nr:actin-related protein 2/3 complex subunit 2A [Tanacetum cinerariifolium]
MLKMALYVFRLLYDLHCAENRQALLIKIASAREVVMGAPLRVILKRLAFTSAPSNAGVLVLLVHRPNESFFLVPQPLLSSIKAREGSSGDENVQKNDTSLEELHNLASGTHIKDIMSSGQRDALLVFRTLCKDIIATRSLGFLNNGSSSNSSKLIGNVKLPSKKERSSVRLSNWVLDGKLVRSKSQLSKLILNTSESRQSLSKFKPSSSREKGTVVRGASSSRKKFRIRSSIKNFVELGPKDLRKS